MAGAICVRRCLLELEDCKFSVRFTFSEIRSNCFRQIERKSSALRSSSDASELSRSWKIEDRSGQVTAHWSQTMAACSESSIELRVENALYYFDLSFCVFLLI